MPNKFFYGLNIGVNNMVAYIVLNNIYKRIIVIFQPKKQ